MMDCEQKFLVTARLAGYQQSQQAGWGKRVKYYAHTANDENGKPLPDTSGQWQPLCTHLRNVATLAQQFAAPLGLAPEAELAGLLHDL